MTRVSLASRSWILFLLALLLTARQSSTAQVVVLTQHNDNARTGLNPNETMLSPSNVNSTVFGKLFSLPVDGLVVAQPLYMSGVSIPGKGTHNVVFVVTQHDSVYAFDADSNEGANAIPLWQVSFIDPANGITTVPIAEQGCTATVQFTESGIMSTPVVDQLSSTIYVVAKTKENGTYIHRLHALDVATGIEKMTTAINASMPSALGTTSLSHVLQMGRPSLLLYNGIVYVSFGSNGCDQLNTHGWVLAYAANTLLPMGMFNTSPDKSLGLGNLWQSGAGLAADASGNIFFETANGAFDANTGGRDFGSTFLHISLGADGLNWRDYFTPYDWKHMQAYDLDLGSAGVVLVDVPGATHQHLVIGSGKEGSVYVVDRDNMGGFNSVDNSQIIQFMYKAVGRMFNIPAYWNGRVYFTGQHMPAMAYSVDTTVGKLSSTPVSQSSTLCCSFTPSVSSSGNTNGVLWVPQQGSLMAFDASNLSHTLYDSSKVANGRDNPGTMAHFVTPTIANGKVYLAGSNSTGNLMNVFGFFPVLSTNAGNNQSGQVFTTLPTALQVKATDPYSGLPISGVTVTFSDGGKGGTFSAPAPVTNGQGLASTTYTLPKTSGTYTITAKSSGYVTATFTETGVPGPAVKILVYSGGGQKLPVTTTFPKPLVAKLADTYNNGVSGGTITFTDLSGTGTVSPTSAVTDSFGRASTTYKAGTVARTVTIRASSPGATNAGFGETVTAGPATTVLATSGNNQSAPPSTLLASALVVTVKDQYGNLVNGATVTFSDNGAGGTFSTTTPTTGTNGQASVTYTTPSTSQTVTNTATSGTGSANFTETVQ